MKRTLRLAALILALAVLALALAGCSSKKGGGMQIFSADHEKEYQSAAKKHFSGVSWTAADPSGSLQEALGSVGESTRHVVVISGDKSILNREQVPGKRYTFYVFDDGSGDISISMRFCVGTTDNCVRQGNVVQGEMSFSNTLNVAADGVTDPSERAGYIFNVMYEALVQAEGK